MRAYVRTDHGPPATSAAVDPASAAEPTLEIPIVYLPGIDGGGDLLLGTEPRLAAIGHLLCFGYAREADLPSRDVTYARLAQSVALELARRGIGPALIVSESFGVSLALQLALDHPRHVAGMLLVNGFAYHPWRLRLAITAFVTRYTPDRIVRWAQAFGSNRFLFNSKSDAAAKDAFASRGYGALGEGWLRRLDMLRRVDLRTELEKIQAPTQLVASSRDWIVPSVRAGRVMQRGMPNAELEVVRRGGHLILPDAAEPWEQRLRALSERAQAASTTAQSPR